MLQPHGAAVLPGGQPDEDAASGDRGATAAGALLRADVQRDLAVHPQYMRGMYFGTFITHYKGHRYFLPRHCPLYLLSEIS